MGGEIVEQKQTKLLDKFGERYSLEPRRVYDTLMRTAFRDATSMEQVIALLVVADQYGLNPFTKEIYAFPDKAGGVVPVVGVDGWNRIAQSHPQFDGLELRYSETLTTPDRGKPCPDWIEAVVYRKDRGHPIVIREYLAECYRTAFKSRDGHMVDGPWQSHTTRMLRHKTMIQAYRVAFGFHGIYDPDEAERIAESSEPLPALVPQQGRHGVAGTMTLDITVEPPAEAEKPEAEESVVEPEQAADDGTGL